MRVLFASAADRPNVLEGDRARCRRCERGPILEHASRAQLQYGARAIELPREPRYARMLCTSLTHHEETRKLTATASSRGNVGVGAGRWVVIEAATMLEDVATPKMHRQHVLRRR